MSVNATNWTDPDTCPFCGGELSSPGVGFIDHIDENARCETSFENWRSNLTEDLTGEWSG